MSQAKVHSGSAGTHPSGGNAAVPGVGAAARACPALFIAGIASGQGKTTVTAALARYHSAQGLRVRVFKSGPDFLDPMILQAASGHAVENLDLWMVGIARSRALLYAAACESDLILIEGAMGLYDGKPSGADLAEAFGVPVAAVIDAGAMAETFGALALGLKSFRNTPFAGVIANRVASAGHRAMLAGSLPAGIPMLAAIGKAAVPLPERHLGLVQAAELPDLLQRLDALAQLVKEGGFTALPPPLEFEASACEALPPTLSGLTIAVARDAAFSFIYPGNLATLQELGAQLAFFSPLANNAVPAAAALWLPGGYPELHAERLSANLVWRDSVRAFHAAGKPMLAECGGMMSLFESLETVAGQGFAMAGLLPGRTIMQKKLAGLGMQSVQWPQGELRGHTFHYSRTETQLAAERCAVKARDGAAGEAVYRRGALTASYMHAYFPSCPAAAAALFSAAASSEQTTRTSAPARD